MAQFLTYIRDISDGASNVELARIAGVNKSTVGRWDETLPNLEPVVRLARHYGRPVLEALVVADLITAEDVARTSRPLNVETLSNHAILREIDRRMTHVSDSPATIPSPEGEEPNPDDYDLTAGHIDRPDDRPAD